MIVFRLLPVIFSFLLMAAHFSRANQTVLVVISILIPSLFLVKRRIVLRAIQVLLIAAGAEWIRSMLVYIDVRKAAGDDWTRLAVIMTAVAFYTAASGLFLQARKVLDKYPANN